MPDESLIDVKKADAANAANKRLWAAVQRAIRVTFERVDDENDTAKGVDVGTQRVVFTATLRHTARDELIETLKTFDFTQDTVVIPDDGGDGKGPKMTINLRSGLKSGTGT